MESLTDVDRRTASRELLPPESERELRNAPPSPARGSAIGDTPAKPWPNLNHDIAGPSEMILAPVHHWARRDTHVAMADKMVEHWLLDSLSGLGFDAMTPVDIIMLPNNHTDLVAA